MFPSTVIHLRETVKTKGCGVLGTYKLGKNYTLPVLVLRQFTSTDDEIAAIAEASTAAINSIKLAATALGPRT